MLPASEYSLARWKKTSTSWSSSRIPSLISWRFAEITNSLLMDAPQVQGENRSFRKARGRHQPSAVRVIQRTVVPAHERKIFQPCKVENRFSNTLPAEAAVAALIQLPVRTRDLNRWIKLAVPSNLLESRPSLGQFSSQIAGAGHCSRAPALKTSL